MGRPKGSKTKNIDLSKYWLPEGVIVKSLPEIYNKETKLIFIDSIHGEFESYYKAIQDAGHSIHPIAKSLRKSLNNPGQSEKAVLGQFDIRINKLI